MEEKNHKKKIPNIEDYKVKFVFKQDSIVNVNNVIKECFLMKINRTLNQ